MSDHIPFLDLTLLHAPVREELHESARRVIDSGIYINGPETAAFAAELAATLGSGSVVPVSNGLDAIRLILRAYIESGRLKPGDTVIAPANTYIASVLPITEFDLNPLLVRPDLTTYGLDWQAAEEAVGEAERRGNPVKALVTVHLYGTPSWDFEVADRLRDRGILIIEDNAQAIGASLTHPATGERHHTGALGDAAAFSFYPTKNIGALGDAGAVATTDASFAATVRALANYGSTQRYHNDFIGYNCRMDELQAAMLRVKLRHLPEVTAARQARARLYSSLISHPDVTLPPELPGMEQVWHQYVVRTPRRDDLRRTLAEAGVATDIHYPLSLFSQKCYSNPGGATLQAAPGARALAEKLAAEVLSLPIATATPEEIEKTATIINSF
ncbi:MAG: DegT/DnrJ/EryC1/StrS family aminotransferase [Muribaculaceae bacterium]|nr:DegT/DnrJ/EryC1/StrS family aminotransferase [Muribaculaceae bacterium]